MAKNVLITEDGKNKVAENVAKIRTSLSGGGTCDWIPKDDVPLETLEVSEDGTYRPSEDYYGFDKVIASGIGTVTMGEFIEKTVTKNGTYNITDESGSPYGYSKIVVNVDTSDDSGGDSGGGGNTPVVGKDEDGNDTMAEADDDGNIVMTALPTEIKVIIPPTKLEYNRYEEIDYSGISVYAYISKAIHWLGTTTIAVAEGSSDNTVSIGGSTVIASVGDGIFYAPDRTGQNDVQLVWDGAKWVKPSNYSAEKAVWKSDKYPTGKIPFDELIFPVSRANLTDDYTDNIGDTPVSISSFGSFRVFAEGTLYPEEMYHVSGGLHNAVALLVFPRQHSYSIIGTTTTPISPGDTNNTLTIGTSTVTAERGNAVLYAPDRTGINDILLIWNGAKWVTRTDYAYISYNILGASSNKGARSLDQTFFDDNGEEVMMPDQYGEPTPMIVRVSRLLNSYTQNKLTVYYGVYVRNATLQEEYHFISSNHPIQEFTNVPTENEWGKMAWSMLYKSDSTKEKDICRMTLPIQWKRPGDGKILETTFTAWIKDDGGDNNAAGGNTRPGNQNIDVPQ